MVKIVFTKKPNDPPLLVTQFLYTALCRHFNGDFFSPISGVPQEALVINEDPLACDYFKGLTEDNGWSRTGRF
jgi:hypothetical protein